MCYKKAAGVLPPDLLQLVQEYVSGEYIYIPKKLEEKKKWGSCTSTKQEMKKRNGQIYNDYITGSSSAVLSEKYYLSVKSIQRIIREQRDRNVS